MSDTKQKRVGDAVNAVEVAGDGAAAASGLFASAPGFGKMASTGSKIGSVLRGAGKVAPPAALAGAAIETASLVKDGKGTMDRARDEMNSKGPFKRAIYGALNPVTSIATAAREGGRAVKAVAGALAPDKAMKRRPNVFRASREIPRRRNP
jgi:hypothetical protein